MIPVCSFSPAPLDLRRRVKRFNQTAPSVKSGVAGASESASIARRFNAV